MLPEAFKYRGIAEHHALLEMAGLFLAGALAGYIANQKLERRRKSQLQKTRLRVRTSSSEALAAKAAAAQGQFANPNGGSSGNGSAGVQQAAAAGGEPRADDASSSSGGGEASPRFPPTWGTSCNGGVNGGISDAAGAAAGATRPSTRHSWAGDASEMGKEEGEKERIGSGGCSPRFLRRLLTGIAPECFVDSLCGSWEVPSFGVYVAQRIMDVQDEQELQRYPNICEALRTIGDAYLRADVAAIADCISAYSLDKHCLASVARVEIVFSDLTPRTPSLARAESAFPDVHDGGWATSRTSVAPQPSAMRGSPSITLAGGGGGGGNTPGAASGGATPTSATVAGSLQLASKCSSLVRRQRHALELLMHEYEALLVEYFSCNWHRLDAVVEANATATSNKWHGQACNWVRGGGGSGSWASGGSPPPHDNSKVQASGGSAHGGGTAAADPEGSMRSSASSGHGGGGGNSHGGGGGGDGSGDNGHGGGGGGNGHGGVGGGGDGHGGGGGGDGAGSSPPCSSGRQLQYSISHASFANLLQLSPYRNGNGRRGGRRHGGGQEAAAGVHGTGSQGGSMASMDSMDSTGSVGGSRHGGSYYGRGSALASIDSTAARDAADFNLSAGPLPDWRRQRARDNWRRAWKAAIKRITLNVLVGQRNFKTMYQIFKELRKQPSPDGNLPGAAPGRQPVLLLLGGGMAAGKSSVRRLIGQDVLWSKVGRGAVVIEADAIKDQDAVFLELSRNPLFQGDPSISNLVHEYSTKAAEMLLVTAINEQRDIVFDATMMWLPFVEQTISMVRDYRHQYRRGPGYCRDGGGNTVERYWEQVPGEEGGQERHTATGCGRTLRPYRIELVGVCCDPGLAVARGMLRYLRTGRSVPVDAQLRSHSLFSANFEHYAGLVDSATLYHTGNALTSLNKAEDSPAMQPKVIAHKSQSTLGEMLVNPAAYTTFRQYSRINDHAADRRQLYENCTGPVEALPAVPVSDPVRLHMFRTVLKAAEKFTNCPTASKGANSSTDANTPARTPNHKCSIET